MAVTADTTMIALGLGTARVVVRQAKADAKNSAAREIAADAEKQIGQALEALRRIEGGKERIPLKINGEVVGEIDADTAEKLTTPGSFSVGYGPDA